ncbi:MAG: DUF2207 domain-containing protein [Deltaproteobacteria bacterium]|nr:DUF2207 domain-containing protein [Deltaproteobacteria bacterium]
MKKNRVLILFSLLVLMLIINALVLLSFSSQDDGILPPSYDEEPIISFDSELRVTHDDVLFITEQIKVKSLGKNLKRGITRRLALTMPEDEEGKARALENQLVSVLRNGETIAVAEPQEGNGFITYYLGEADKFLTPGIYHYLFQYSVRSPIIRKESHKYLKHDITGASLFPVLAASAVVRIPEQLQSENVVFKGHIITPADNESGIMKDSKDVKSSFEIDDGEIDPASRGTPRIKLWTTRALQPLERFEIEVGWAVGVPMPAE